MSSLFISRSISQKISSFDYYLIFLICFVGALCFTQYIYTDPDVAWHIKAGEFIFANRLIPSQDPFTFTSDQNWYNISWLWDIVIYIIYQYFGFKGLYVLMAALFAATATYLYNYLASFKGTHHEARYITTALSMLLVWDTLYMRPQLLSYLLCIATMHLAIRNKPHTLGLILITILWANIHGSFVTLFFVLGAIFLSAVKANKNKQASEIFIVGCLCFAASIINPIGLKIYWGIARTMHSVMTSYIMEWMPFQFGQIYSDTLVIILVLLIGGFVNRNNIPMPFKILAAIWLLMALDSRRSFSYFAIYGAPYLLYIVHDVVSKSPSKFIPTKLTTGIVCTLMITGMKFYTDATAKPFNQNSLFPEKAIQRINAICKYGNIFNNYNTGGFLLKYLSKGNKHFIDGRAGTAFSEEFLEHYIQHYIKQNNMAALTENYNIDAALISNGDLTFASTLVYLHGWRIAYSDADFRVYVNPRSKACKLY